MVFAERVATQKRHETDLTYRDAIVIGAGMPRLTTISFWTRSAPR